MSGKRCFAMDGSWGGEHQLLALGLGFLWASASVLAGQRMAHTAGDPMDVVIKFCYALLP